MIRARCRMTFGIVVVLLLALVSSAVLAKEPVAELAGTYYCHDTDANGTGYRGTVRFAKHGEVYYLKWTFASGPPTLGVGSLHGNTLAVSYYGQSIGVLLYEVDGTTLAGRWSDAGTPGRVFVETLTRVPEGQEPSDRHEHPPNEHPADSASEIRI